MKRNKSAVWNVLHHYLPELVEGLSCEDVMKICGILDANSFRIDKYGTRSIFLATSMVKKYLFITCSVARCDLTENLLILKRELLATSVSDCKFCQKNCVRFFYSSNPSNQFLTPVNLTRKKTSETFES